MARLLAMVYGAIAYITFLLSFLYAIAFVGNLPQTVPALAPWVPRTIDAGGPTAGPIAAVIVNGLLMGLFAVQHTVMARPGFKSRWTRIVPLRIERSTYVLLSSLILFLLYWQWRPMAATVWSTQPGTLAHVLLNALFWFGWLFVLLSTFMIDHFQLFGLKQVSTLAADGALPTMKFVVRGFYRFVRHPIMLGFIIAFWAAPVMTLGHLYFAATTTAYILVALRFEEHDLVRELGTAYVEYRSQVSMIVPAPPRRSK